MKRFEYKIEEIDTFNKKELFYILPKLEIPKGKLRIDFVVSYKNELSDIYNFLKPFIDILQKKYGFNDRDIYELNIKEKRGEEFIEFNIEGI